MALFSYAELQKVNMFSSEAFSESTPLKSAASINVNQNDRFDIFLSHSYADKNIIPQLKKALEGFGFSVYVDWINDRLLSRDSVNKDTAKILQQRMKQSKSLVYATSENSSNSRWMPWELGYFDGIKDKMVAILPIKKLGNGFSDDFKGEEYLGLYYYVSIDNASKILENKPMAMEPNALRAMYEELSRKKTLFIHADLEKYVTYEDWINGEKPSSDFF